MQHDVHNIHDTHTETHATQHASLLLLGLLEAEEGLARQVPQAWRDMKYLDLGLPWGMLGHTWHPFLNVKKIGVSTFVCFRRSFGLVAIKWPCVCSQAQETSHGSVGLTSTSSRRGLLSAASGAQCTDKSVSIGKAMHKGSLVRFNEVQHRC